jgi:hypothetical protein
LNHSTSLRRTGPVARRSIIFCLAGAVSAFTVTPLCAATIYGTVFGPDGPVPNARVVAYRCAGAPEEYPADGNGDFSIEFPDGSIDCLEAAPPAGESGLVGESVDWVDASSDRQVNLFLAEKVTISGQVSVPAGFEGFVEIRGNRLDKTSGSCWPELDENNRFEAECAAGVYAVTVTGSCEWFEEPINIYTCPYADWFGSTAVDASEGSVDGVGIALARTGKSLTDERAPVAGLISVGEADEGGIAMVRGAPGAVPGPARVGIVNLGTGHWTQGGARADGSFDIPFLAPPGSWLEVRQDPTSFTWGGDDPRAAGTIVRVPPPGGSPNSFAVLNIASEWFQAVEASYIENLGAKDTGQVWISGELASRQWQPGERFNLEGEVRVYSRNAASISPGGLSGYGRVVLERVFDPHGKQEFSNPVFMSHYLTPTGLPVERRGGNGSSGSHHGVQIGRLSMTGFQSGGPNQIAGRWSSSVAIPAGLPAGVYSLVIEAFVDNVEREELHFEKVYSQVFDTPFTRGHATLVTVGSPSPGRLSWVLGLNDFSNGARGTVALEDQDRIGIAARVTTNSKPFVLPPAKARTGAALPYRLEPFVPLMGVSNRGWMPPPTVPLEFPSGNLRVEIQRPDGSVRRLGPAPIAQFHTFTPSSKSGYTMTPASNVPKGYYGLTTNDPRFEVEFEQYGLHTVTMDGAVDDIWGTRYRGGGTYEVWVAEHLDLETGVFANTPFEVGDAFSPTVIVQPGVPAEVEITISHYPQSDPAQKVTHVIEGKANRFGYFHQGAGAPFTFDAPGEYRVDVVARHWDEDGVLWMGAETWASVVETPNSPLVTHGLRNNDCSGTAQQWMVASESSICGTHLPFPYQTGDIAWMVDLPVDPYFTAMVPIITVQDTRGDFADLFRQRGRVRGFNDSELSRESSEGEMRLFSSRPNQFPPTFDPDAADTHWAYAYSGAARPGVRIRDMVTERENQESYWRFDDTYNYQPGNGSNGDLPNDFKFQFGGAVYRAPDEDFYYYGAYGSLWVLLPNDDPTGTRIMPPFQGNGGGPSGGPIMSLKGEDIDLFFHPTGVRPGSILEVGDSASFAGQIAPTLGTQVSIRVTAPSGEQYEVNGRSNKVGYFYLPNSDFIVDEPGVWTARVVATFRGKTSAGQVSEPYPQGGVLGTRNRTFEFYVVDREAEALEVALPEQSWVQPGQGPIDIRTEPGDDLVNTRLHYSTVMPGFLMEAGDKGGLTYTYDAPGLRNDFPNLDILDQDFRYGVDTVTMSFLVSGEDGSGNTVYRARQVLLQGEKLLAPQQLPSTDAAFAINAGLSDAWYNPQTAGQGFFIIVFEELESIFLSWFTYDTEASGEDAQFGDAGHRWLTAFGKYSNNSATLEVVSTSNGVFDTATSVEQEVVGTISLTFDDCESGQVDYDLSTIGLEGQIPIERIVSDLVPACEGSAPAGGNAGNGFQVNRGLNDAWYQPATDGQGFFIITWPEIERMFLSWFTYETELPAENTATLGDSGQRWVTALGPYSGNTAELDITVTSGGLFDDPTTVTNTPGGTITVEFEDCTAGTVSYDIDAIDRQGDIAIQRIALDNVPTCEALDGVAAAR